MKEAKTKLVCNLKPGEKFRQPNCDGEWATTGSSVELNGKKYYVCKDEKGRAIMNQASRRVELIGKSAARKKEGAAK